MKKFAILGLGTFGASLAHALTEKGAEVIAVDRDMDRIEEIQDYVSVAVRLDSTDENALKAQGVHEVDIAVVCIGEDFESNLLTSVILKQLGVETVITRATRPIEEKILLNTGIDRVVIPEQEVGEKLAYSLMHPNLKEIFYLAGEITVAEVDAPKSFFDKSLHEIELRSKFGLNMIVLRRADSEKDQKKEDDSNEQVIVPHAKTIIRAGDTLVLVGKKTDLNKLLSRSGK
ncbi:MAG: TrkA family potassium uptake protein [Calditrichia bacterium]